jgi:hypothetical protein
MSARVNTISAILVFIISPLDMKKGVPLAPPRVLILRDSDGIIHPFNREGKSEAATVNLPEVGVTSGRFTADP